MPEADLVQHGAVGVVRCNLQHRQVGGLGASDHLTQQQCKASAPKTAERACADCMEDCMCPFGYGNICKSSSLGKSKQQPSEQAENLFAGGPKSDAQGSQLIIITVKWLPDNSRSADRSVEFAASNWQQLSSPSIVVSDLDDRFY
jgi:hypothetical protein